MKILEEYLETLKKYSFNPEAIEHIYLQMVEYFKVYYHEGATNAKIDYYKDYAEQLKQEKEELKDYKKMWEELSKRAYITREFVRGPKEMNNKLLELIQELEQKYKIGDKNE